MNKEKIDLLMAQRLKRCNEITRNPTFIKYENELCKRDIFHWVHNWVFTFNPQNTGTEFSAWLPFEFFPKQVELIGFIDKCYKQQEDGLIVKGRELGYSWCTMTYATHKWLYFDGFVSTFTANLADNVDKIGDPKSLFEKGRSLLKFLPPWMLPRGFKFNTHDSYMRIVNPENGNVISGAAGEEAGRAGRSTMFFIDEAAFIEQADRIDAATSANAKTRIWGSTVNGMGNLFARKRFGGKLRPDQIFVMHFKDDPRKTKAWEEKERKRLEPHVFASEHDLDFSASVEGICIPAKWVTAAKKLKHLVKVIPSVYGVSGGDVGGGKAKSTVVTRFGSVVTLPAAWNDPDTVETAARMLEAANDAALLREDGVTCKSKVLYFDSVAIGRGVLDVLMRNEQTEILTVPINTGIEASDTTWDDGKTSKDKFGNLKAELWGIMREFFKNTYEFVLFLEGQPGGIEHLVEDCISLPDDEEGPEAMQLASELSLPKRGSNERGKLVMERKIAMAKRGLSSPDFADALVLTFAGNSSLEVWAKLGDGAGQAA
jgi:phage terminase large subunit